jgi:hypothetical protein
LAFLAEQDRIRQAEQEALASSPGYQVVKSEIDPETGEIKIWMIWDVDARL